MSPEYRYYLNALFDLELGGYPVEKVRKTAAEMSVLFLPLLGLDDRIVLDVGVPDGYLEYLQQFFSIGNQVRPSGSSTTPFNTIVWGWNDSVIHRLSITSCLQAVESAIVAQVNNRKFCHQCSGKYGSGVPGSRFCSTVNEIDAIADHLSDSYPLVVKPAFGGAGFGFIILDTRSEVENKRSTISYYCQHGGCTVEPWCRRTSDLSSCLQISDDGTVGPLLFHRQWTNRFGAFYGIYIHDNDPVINHWKGSVSSVTIHYAEEAAVTGYRGPLGIDSFIYLDQHGGEHCAAGIEINGRYTMGLLAHQIRTKIAPDKPVLFRSLNRRWCSLPQTYEQLRLLLAEAWFDVKKKEGIMLLTPLQSLYDGCWEQPQRSFFFIVGHSEQQIERFDNTLRRICAPVH